MAAPTQSTVEIPRTRTGAAKLRLFTSDWAGTTLAQFALLLLGLVSGIVSGRLLGPQGRGELAAVTLWPIAIAYVATVGLNHAIVFHAGKRQHSVSEVWTGAIVIGLFQSLVVFIAGAALMPLLLHRYSSDLRTLGLIFLLAMPAMLLSTYPPNLLLASGDVLRFNLLRLTAPACYTAGLLVLLVLHEPSVSMVAGVQITGYLISVIAALISLYRQKHPAFVFRIDVLKKLLGYGLRTHVANLTSYLNQRVDQLILALLIPAKDLGLYAMAVALSTSASFLPAAVGMLTFSRGAAQTDLQARRTLGRSFRASLLWLTLACGALFVAAPFLIDLLLGPRFAGSVLACRLLLPGTIVLGLNQILYSGANAMGRPSLPSCAEGAGLLLTAIGLILMVPRYGYIGAAVVSSSAYAVSFIVMLILSRTFMQLRLRELFLGNSFVRSNSEGREER